MRPIINIISRNSIICLHNKERHNAQRGKYATELWDNYDLMVLRFNCQRIFQPLQLLQPLQL